MTSGHSSENHLSASELERYSRHLVIPEVGVEGQLKLKAARVLVVGAGGLGSPVIQYLAAAGIGTIGIVDFDSVDKSNLQRQILFSTGDVGKAKAEVAGERARRLNPEINIHQHQAKLSADNIADIFEQYTIVVDGSDNFETRYLISDACVLLDKVNIHGAVHRFDGQVSVFHPGQGSCYRCIFSEPPEPGAILNCAEAGVLGVLPGIVGTIQATECIKVILSIGTSLVDKLLIVNALDMSFRTINLARNPKCIACGAEREITSLIDLKARHADVKSACIAGSHGAQNGALHTQSGDANEIAPQDLALLLAESEQIFLIDVREVHEYDYCHLGQAVNLPLSGLDRRINEIPNDIGVVVYCKSGARSQKAVAMLRKSGLQKVRHLTGGLNAWSKQVDASISVL
ncbi:MAG TPA: molybdopterin-synthase adenylyltransferase MoeB [Drouetiella sp.]|jgi:sulfur-carrier protein adenylyltransferase/sulfurtransferase